MTNEVDSEGSLLADIECTKKIGTFLLRYSLDELSRLFNVLKGGISYVGPRPLPRQYLSRYRQEQDRRHDVKQGITGWAQVNGRHAFFGKKSLDWMFGMLAINLFLLDLKILFLIIHKVILKKDIVPVNKGSMEEFLGAKKVI